MGGSSVRALYFLAGALAVLVALTVYLYFSDPLKLFKNKETDN